MQNNQNSHQAVWRIAAPMMLSNITLPLLGLVDTAVMGHLDQAYYLGAVAVGAMIFNFIYWGFGFLRMATVGLSAQAFGEKNGDELRALLLRGIILALSIALVLLVSQQGLIQLALNLVQPSDRVAGYASEYFSIRIWSAPAALINYVVLGWLLGLQRARVVMLLMVVVNLLNLLLDLFFVLGLGMQVAGVALASVIAEYSGLLLGIWLIHRQLRQHPGRWIKTLIVDRAQFIKLISLNRDIFIRTISLLFVFAFFTTQGARAGDVIVAANAVLFNFQTFMAYVLDGYAHAAEALVGEAVGQRNRQQLQRAVKASLWWSLVSALVFVVIYTLFGQQVIALMTDIQDVKDVASEYLPWLVVMPIVAVWSYLYDGVFIGATRAREMRDAMLTAVLIVYLPVWYVTQPWGNHGLWFAMLCFLAARGVLMALYYRHLMRRHMLIPSSV